MEILVNHIPGNSLSRFTHRQYGWSDAAEVLIFLAGMAFAMRCGKQNEGGEWRRWIGRAALVVAILERAGHCLHSLDRSGLEPPNRLDVKRRGQEVNDCVEQWLYALVFEGRAQQDGDQRQRETASSDRSLQVSGGDFFALQEAGRDLVVSLSDCFDHSLPRSGRIAEELRWDLLLDDRVNGELGADLCRQALLALRTLGLLELREQIFDLAVIGLQQGDGILFGGHGNSFGIGSGGTGSAVFVINFKVWVFIASLVIKSIFSIANAKGTDMKSL